MVANIIDIRPKTTATTTDQASLRDEVLAGLSKPAGQRTLPTMLLYDEKGLQLYDDITVHAPEYYLFSAEEEILKKHAKQDIVPAMLHGQTSSASVIELGAGALRKTSVILDAMASNPNSGTTGSGPALTYYALDLDDHELKRTLDELDASIGKVLQGKVEAKGLAGTFDDGIRWILEGGLRGQSVPLDQQASQARVKTLVRKASPTSSSSRSNSSDALSSPTTAPSTPGDSHAPVHIMFLGSSLGNFARGEDAAFLRSLPLRAGSGDTLLIGLDHDNDGADIEHAYNDSKGYTKEFILNGLVAAGRELGDNTTFDRNKWEYVNKYDTELRRHTAYVKSTCDQTIRDSSSGQEFAFTSGETVEIEHSHKFSDKDAHSLFTEAELRPIQRWTDKNNRYSLWLLERPPFLCPLLKSPTKTSTPFGVPTIAEWETMWSIWDFVTLRMIPPTMLFQKPIDLRHICLFYLGHIPTFLDIHLSRILGEPYTEPEDFKTIFERGIDPNVDDPSKCHSHSEVPKADEDWPTLDTILTFQGKVRSRVHKLYEDIESGQRQLTRKTARVLQMTLEHEAWHVETLLYMLLQRAGTGTIPPPDFVAPSWDILHRSWDEASKSILKPSSSTVTLGPADVVLGHDDVEADDTNDSKPELATLLDGVEFGWDNESPRRTVKVGEFRAEWRPITNGEYLAFRDSQSEGQVPFPCSWVKDKNTETVQVRTLYGPVSMDIAWDWPVVADYNGLAAYAAHKGGRIPTDAELRLFKDTFEVGYEGGANVGFRNWHPVPATTGSEKAGGRGHNGGVWEWTSTVFDTFEGFAPSVLYPGYSADFFDGCHNVVMGGSYATIPRLSERASLRNTYQRNYGYAWTGARVVYDA